MPHRLGYQSILDRLRSGVAPGVPGFIEDLRAAPTPNPNRPYPPELWRHLLTKPLILESGSNLDPADWQGWVDGMLSAGLVSRPSAGAFPGIDARAECGAGDSGQDPCGQAFGDPGEPLEVLAGLEPRHGNVLRMVIPEAGSQRAGTRHEPLAGEDQEEDPFEFDEMPVPKQAEPPVRLRADGATPPDRGTASGRLRCISGPPLRQTNSGLCLEALADSEPFRFDSEDLLPLTYETPKGPIDWIEERGYYPYEFLPKLRPVDLHPEHAFPAMSFRTAPTRHFWWKDSRPAKAPPRIPRGNPSFLPKGFVGFQPITRSQPSFKTLTTWTGDYGMAETASRDRAAGLTPEVSASTNLQSVQRTAIRLAERHWDEFQPPVEPVDVLDFPAKLEFVNSTRLWFTASGFDFQTDPDRGYRNGFHAPAENPPVLNLAALLAESEIDSNETGTTESGSADAGPSGSGVRVTRANLEPQVWDQPVVWDELAEPAAAPNGIPALAAALELYEPPTSSAERQPAPAAEETVEEQPAPQEPEIVPPEVRDFMQFPAPRLRAELPIAAPLSEPVSTASTRIHLPALSLHPLRPPMSLGPLPEAVAKADVSAGRPAVTPGRLQPGRPESVRTGFLDAEKTQGKSAPGQVSSEAKSPQTEALQTEAPQPKPALASSETLDVKGAAEHRAASLEASPDSLATPPPALHLDHASEAAVEGKGKNRGGRDIVEDPIEEPTALSEEVEDALAQAATGPESQSVSAPGPELAKSAGSGPDGSGQPVQEAKPENQPAAGKKTPHVEAPAPVAESSTKSFLLNPEPVPAPAGQTLSIGLNPGSALPESAGMGSGLKAGIAVALLAALGGVAVWQFSGSTAARPAAKSSQSAPQAGGVETAGAILGEAGWSQDWTLDPNGTRVRQVAFYRPSMTVIDYRVEFLAEIENKAVSWVARAANSKNYYLAKLVQIKGGLEPQINLVRFAVRDGKPGEIVEKPLPFPVRAGEAFKVRMDVIADKFTVNVQGKAVDEWTDSKLLTGGFGVAHEGAERGQIRSIQMWHLKPRSK